MDKSTIKKIFIYCLKNPEDDKVFYVGKSKNVWNRVLEHINKSRLNKDAKDGILDSILKKGLMPRFEILEEIEIDIHDKASSIKVSSIEKKWIAHYVNNGFISNRQHNSVSKIDSDNNPYLKSIKCLYCGNETKVKSLKKKFCCDTHRVYWNREQKSKNKEIAIQDATKPINIIKPFEQPKTNFVINTTRHKKYKEGDPPEKSNAFFLKYGVFKYDDI